MGMVITMGMAMETKSQDRKIPEVTRRRIVDIHTYLPVLIDIIKSAERSQRDGDRKLHGTVSRSSSRFYHRLSSA